MTTTMVETFDTQMLDYQNDDYSMHVSSSDAWFQDEAIMEDDGLPIDNTNISIEVDMEPYDEDHNTEYEMADGSEHYDLETTEFLDVEVYDASRAHSPAAILAVETPTLPPSDVADVSHLELEFIEPLISEQIPFSPFTERTEIPVSNDNVLESDATASSGLSPYPRQEEEFAGLPEMHYPDAQGERVPSLATAEGSLDQPSTTSAVEAAAVASAQSDSQDLVDSGESDPATDDRGAGTTDLAQAESLGQIAFREGISTPINHQSSFHHDEEEVEEAHADYDSSVVSSGDPHEISEGVYIDPPPPVLLSFALVDQPEISLFNAPSQSEKASRDIPVLLAQLPILYYEPLSSVFEALRQDEHFRNMPELATTELALDAYDLEIILSEVCSHCQLLFQILIIQKDNLYAREVSLHDLNVLHDGMNTPGPLRLRLHTTGSRFIVRYHMLQEHVAQLSIAEPKEADLEPSDEVSEGSFIFCLVTL
jgi:hypothetical protein